MFILSLQPSRYAWIYVTTDAGEFGLWCAVCTPQPPPNQKPSDTATAALAAINAATQSAAAAAVAAPAAAPAPVAPAAGRRRGKK